MTFGKSMNAHTGNQSWVVDRGGQVIQKKAQSGVTSLNDWERLVYCLWVADYGMRNAGDLETAKDIYADFQSIAQQAAKKLSLPLTHESFSMAQHTLEEKYFDRFDAICNEIKSAEPRELRGRD